MVKTIVWSEGRVIILDQSRLPLEVVYVVCDAYGQVVEAIKSLKIRGAPAIGIAAAMGVGLAAQDIKAESFDDFIKALEPVFESMLSARPTAVNISWAVERIKKVLESNRDLSISTLKETLIQEAERILHEDIEINRAIGMWGAQFISDGDCILTHCNAGSLATGGYGTATAPMLQARDQGKSFTVIADETRPVLQGARLTAWELMQEGIDVTLITDNAAGALMQKSVIDLAIVGTDRTAKNGDVANKIGTYSIAVLCKEHGIPFYVTAPLSSIDFSIHSGEEIPIEERPPEEVTEIFGKCRIAPQGVRVRNIAFDVTPARLVSAIITERGAFKPDDIKELARHEGQIEKLRINNQH
jgi:methylthioribose-1-phosphate isomerase